MFYHCSRLSFLLYKINNILALVIIFININLLVIFGIHFISDFILRWFSFGVNLIKFHQMLIDFINHSNHQKVYTFYQSSLITLIPLFYQFTNLIFEFHHHDINFSEKTQ